MLRLSRRLATAGVLSATVMASALATAGPAAAAPSPTCVALLTPLGLQALCASGLPSGANFSTAAPNTGANTATSVPVTITDPLASIYSATSTAVDVTLTGPAGTSNLINGTSTSVTSSTVLTTFDLTASSTGLDADPGAYEITVTPQSVNASLTIVLTALGVGALPVDTAAFTVTADSPTPTATIGLEPGGSTPASIDTSGTPFTAGDTVSFTDGSNAAVAGLTLTSPTVSATNITGTVNADGGVAAGSYNLLVTDTAGNVGNCTGCVTVATGPDAVTGLTATATSGTTGTLSWTAPATGATVTSYEFVISKNLGAAQSDAGISVAQATPTSTTATVTGLLPGTTYHVNVVPKHDTISGAGTDASMLTPYKTTVTLSGTPSKPVGGAKITLSGQLTRKVGSTTQPMAGKSVGVYAKFAGATKYARVGSLMTTKADGTYSESYKPTKGGVYVALFLGTPAAGATPGDSVAASTVINKTPQPVLTLVARGKAHGGQFTMHVRGKATPNELGKKVIVYRIVRGTPTKFGRGHLNSKGKYSFVKKHLGPGVYKLRATLKAHFGNLPATSRTFSIRAS